MKVDLFDIEEFIDINSLKEVTSPVLFERGGIPDPNGLISNEIFGVNTRDRKENFAYISLNGYYFHPHVYKVFKRLYRNIEEIVGGTGYYSIDENGQLKKDPNGETGLSFIYDNWDKIKWAKTEGMRNERIDILTKTPKNQIFTQYQIVIPAFYRDISSSESGGGSTTELNSLYVKLIRMCTLLKDESLFDFSFNSTSLSVQNTLVDIYDYFKTKLNKKNGLIRKFLLGKNVDYSVRSVIAAPTFHADRVEDNMIDLKHAAVPISQACTLFYPFVFAWVKNFFERNIIANKMNGRTKDGTVVPFKNPEIYFDDRFISKMINKYIKNPDARYETIGIPLEDGSTTNMHFSGKLLVTGGVSSGISERPMTITDILFMACSEVTHNKHVMITRYPVLHYYGCFFNRIRISSTNETIPMDVNGTVYKWYPKIDLSTPHNRVGVQFIDTLKFSNSYLAGLDGDYDGDQVTSKGLYSLEANAEAEEIMNSKMSLISADGKTMKKTDCEVIQTLFVLTKHNS